MMHDPQAGIVRVRESSRREVRVRTLRTGGRCGRMAQSSIRTLACGVVTYDNCQLPPDTQPCGLRSCGPARGAGISQQHGEQRQGSTAAAVQLLPVLVPLCSCLHLYVDISISSQANTPPSSGPPDSQSPSPFSPRTRPSSMSRPPLAPASSTHSYYRHFPSFNFQDLDDTDAYRTCESALKSRSTKNFIADFGGAAVDGGEAWCALNVVGVTGVRALLEQRRQVALRTRWMWVVLNLPGEGRGVAGG